MYYLGVDGGGTRTEFILIDGEGRIISYRRKGPGNYLQIGRDKLQAVLSQGLAEVTKEAGISNSDITYAFFGLPVYGEVEEAIPLLEGMVGDLLQSNCFRCGNDVEVGWAGSLACQPGINLVGGTGAIGFGKDKSGKTARAGGWGYYCGDEGSAYWLGRKLLSLFGKEADGRLEKTPLYQLVKEEFGLRNDFDLITVVYDELQMKRERIAELALLLYKAATEGDQEAITLYEEAAYEYSLIVKAIITKLSFAPEEKITVSYSGGVFKAGELILKPLQEFLSTEPVTLIPPILQPVTGAALYAWELRQQKREDTLISRLISEEKRVFGQ